MRAALQVLIQKPRRDNLDLLQRFAVPDWPVMCVRPIAVTNNLRAHQSLESVHHLNRHRVRCMSSTRVTDPDRPLALQLAGSRMMSGRTCPACAVR